MKDTKIDALRRVKAKETVIKTLEENPNAEARAILPFLKGCVALMRDRVEAMEP